MLRTCRLLSCLQTPTRPSGPRTIHLPTPYVASLAILASASLGECTAGENKNGIHFAARSQWASREAQGTPAAEALHNPLCPANPKATTPSDSEAGIASCLQAEMGKPQGYLGKKVSWIYVLGTPCESSWSAATIHSGGPTTSTPSTPPPPER